MTCPQCGNNLPDTATFCPQCGSTFRPVAFSYLPAGAPAWPTSLPSRPLYATATASSAENDLPFASQPVAKPRRSTGSILIMLALFILTPLVGIGATLGLLWANGQIGGGAVHASVHVPAVSQQTPTANTPTPAGTSPAQGNQLPTPTDFQTATSPQLGITVKYPSDWVQEAPQTTTSGNTSVLFHPQQQLPVEVSIGRLSAQNSSNVPSASVVNQVNIEGFGTNQNLKNPQILTNTPQHSMIGGVSWDQQDTTFLTDNGDLIHVVSLSVKYKNFYYNILYFALGSVYDEATQKYFKPMFDSFRFQ